MKKMIEALHILANDLQNEVKAKANIARNEEELRYAKDLLFASQEIKEAVYAFEKKL